MAGLNAARKIKQKDAVYLDRADAYIGVMIDDLVTRGVSEPYRMFTSRAEYRLTLRADNADQRLTSLGREWSLVGDARWAAYKNKAQALDVSRETMTNLRMTPNEAKRAGLNVNLDGVRRSALDYLAYPDIELSDLKNIWPELSSIRPDVAEQLEIDARYSGYLDRQKADIAAFKRDENLTLPADVDYGQVHGLSNEVRMKLETHKPATLGQAARIDGLTPAALTLLLAWVKRKDVPLTKDGAA